MLSWSICGRVGGGWRLTRRSSGSNSISWSVRRRVQFEVHDSDNAEMYEGLASEGCTVAWMGKSYTREDVRRMAVHSGAGGGTKTNE